MSWQAIFFDFDGVILDSLQVKTQAFAQMFRPYGPDIEKAVVDYHLKHGGVSRFEKFRYIYAHLLERPLDDSGLSELGREFSALVVQKVVDSPFMPGALETIAALKDRGLPAFIVSGTPDEEMQFIVSRKGLSCYFEEVHGSPRTKTAITAEIILRKGLDPGSCLFIGDAMSDFLAAEANGTHFLGIVPVGGQSVFPWGTPVSSSVRVGCHGADA